MLNRRIALALLLSLLSVPSLGQERGTPAGEKAFREALKGTPFADSPYYGQPIPSVPSKREQENKMLWVQSLDKVGRHPLIRFIALHDLYEELKISDGQRKQLEEVPNPDFVSLRRAVADDSVFDANPKRFRKYLTDFVNLAKRVRHEADEMIEGILSKKQITRVKQIAFQYYLYDQIDPKLAFSYRDTEVSNETAEEISAMLKRLRSDRNEIRTIINLVGKGRAIEKATGKSVVEEFGSVTSSRLTNESKAFLAEHILASPKTAKQKANPRLLRE